MSQYLGDISAYALAVSQGYTGTEEEYAELMASYATVGQTAVTAAQTATTKASEAATSATTATNKASEATTAATTATTKAGEASASASTATSAKDTAVSASQTATTKASEATTAAATATSAKTDAVAANTAAQSAKTAAQTAQTGAETAAASVQSSAAQIQTNADDISELKEDTTQLKSTISDVCSKSLLNGYDKNSVEATNGYWRNTDGTFVASDNYTACNKYAEVKPNTEYSSWYSSGLDSRYTYVCFYDNQKNFISGSVLASSNIITSPANAKYVRVSSVRERVDTYVFCEGTTYNGYHDFGYFITLNDDVNVPNLQEVLEELETFEYTTTDSVGYMTYQGVIDTSQTSFVSKTTDNIPCKEGEIYEYVGDGRWSAYSYVIYNVNGSIIARGQIAGSDRITIPANAVSVKFSSFINATQAEEAPLTVRKISPLTLAEKVENNVYDIENLKSAGESLNGLKIDILGDSWSAVNDTASVKYTNLLASRDNMLVNVLAYSGSGFSLPTSANKPFYVQAQSIRANTDIVFIFGSFNDISAIVSGVQIGDVTDTGTSTICGCINTTIDNILEVNPFAKIIVATPGAWAGYNANGEGGNPNITRALEYVEAIKNVCFKRGYPCIDMLRTLNLKPWIEAFRTAYQPDGTHPNNDGHLKYVYPRVKAVLKEYGA